MTIIQTPNSRDDLLERLALAKTALRGSELPLAEIDAVLNMLDRLSEGIVPEDTRVITTRVTADDPELQAIELISVALTLQPPGARARIVDYIADRFGEQA